MKFVKKLKKISLFIATTMVLAACEKTDLKGFVGGDTQAGSGGGSTTPISNLLVMTSTLPEVSFVEGATNKVVVQFNKPLPRNTTVNWSIENGASDFLATSGTLSLASGADSLELNLTAKTDALYEGEEKFYLRLSGDALLFLGTLSVPLKIQELAAQPAVSFQIPSQTVLKSAGKTNVKVLLSQATAIPIKVDFTISGTAADGVDYTISDKNFVIIEAGTTAKDIVVYPRADVAPGAMKEVKITATAVTSLVSLDSGNATHSVYIQDNGASALTSIAGVTGGTDTKQDGYLTNGNHATISWTAAPGATGYRLAIYNNASALLCGPVTVGASITSYDYAGCNLAEGTTYKISLEVDKSGTYSNANNNMFPFTVDTLPPAAPQILGAFGGTDLNPDSFLAGTVNPSVSWIDTTGENSYAVSVVSETGNLPVCPEVIVGANVTAYSFSDCSLTRGLNYKIKLVARDAAGNQRSASNDLFSFLVTEVPAGYVVTGVMGGTGDTLADDKMNDGVDPIIQWEIAAGAQRYEVILLNMDNSVKCPLVSVPGTDRQVTFTNCRLDLHEQYKVKVSAYDASDLVYPAANSPFIFRHQVGLYISGEPVGPGRVGSYYRGIPITSCGGPDGDLCDSTTPYVVSEELSETQIRVDQNGVLAGTAYSTGVPAIGNGILKVTADYLLLSKGGKISMTGRGFAASNGPGKGADGNPAAGAAHGGFGSLVGALAQAQPYGLVKAPDTLGSGGGTNGANLGGAGGGIAQITVNQKLSFASGSVESGGRNGATGAGGGSGGSVVVNAKNVAGSGGTISAEGGLGGTGSKGGSGGHVALLYENMQHAGGLTGMGLWVRGGGVGTATGTVYYSTFTDPLGYLVVDSGANTQTQGVETPLPLSETFNEIVTRNYGTLILSAGDSYQLQRPELTYRLVVAGTLTTHPTVPTHLQIGLNGYLEWRRNDAINSWTDISVKVGGTLTHSYNASSLVYALNLVTTNLNLAGMIDVQGRGYSAGNGSGTGTGGMGASYGGQGGIASTGARGNAYGSTKNPTDLGSGSLAASGGGYVNIQVTNLDLKGQIIASGSPGCGGGSGGSINITATNVSGTGALLASTGGDGSGGCAGGGGGRIAINYTNTTYVGGVPGIKYDIFGGAGTKDGAAGTVYHNRVGVDTYGNLLVYNGTRTYDEYILTPLSAADRFDSITTDFTGTVWIQPSQVFTLPTPTINYRLVTEGDLALPSGNTLTVGSGGYLEWRKNTPLTVTNFNLDQGGILTHTYNNTAQNYIVSLDVTNAVINGIIDTSKRGYAAANGPGKSTANGTGAGYGGYGGQNGTIDAAAGGTAYDYTSAKIKAPDQIGSGAVINSGVIGGSGGGYVRLNATSTLTLNGVINADGKDAAISTNVNGGGSGGAIYITAHEVKGANGTISATGGSGCIYVPSATAYVSGSGGGGRISVVYDVDSYTAGFQSLVDFEKIRTFGGYGYNYFTGGAGTIYLNYTGAPSVNEKIIFNNGSNPYNQGAETPALIGVTVDKFETRRTATLRVNSADTYNMPSSTLDYRIVVAGNLVSPDNTLTMEKDSYLEFRRGTLYSLTSLKMKEGSFISHSYNGVNAATLPYLVNLDLGTLEMQGGSKIDVSRKGFKPGTGTGFGSNSAAYGGRTQDAQPYGDFQDPVDLGSGDSGTSGGGRIQINVTGTSTLNGILAADGGGSGGTINLRTLTLAGTTAKVSANGGGNDSGGRIAIRYKNDNYGVFNMNLTAYGGDSFSAAGTIFVQDTDEALGTLIIRNYGRGYGQEGIETNLPNNIPVKTVIVDKDAVVRVPPSATFVMPDSTINYKIVVEGTLQPTTSTLTVAYGGQVDLRTNTAFGKPIFNNLVVNQGASIFHSYNASCAVQNYAVNLDLDNFTLDGDMPLNARGFAQACGPGGGPGGNLTSPAGASYGGFGHAGGTAQTQPYGSISNPVDMGSGGGTTWGGRGGGLALIKVANRFTFNGTIKSNAGGASTFGAFYSGSGGSGGGININTNIIDGAGGRVEASGSPGQVAAGGHVPGSGSGGRIAIIYKDDQYTGGLSSVSIKNFGGARGGNINGAAGTTYIEKRDGSNNPLNKHLIMDNGIIAYAEGSETAILQTETFDVIDVGSTTGVYIGPLASFAFSSSDLTYPLRLAGAVTFPGNNLVIQPTGRLIFSKTGSFVLNNLTVEPGGMITHSPNTKPSDLKNYLVNIEANNFWLKPDASIDVSYKGYQCGQGLGAGTINTFGYSGSGGGHGGVGGTVPSWTGVSSMPGGVSYGDPNLQDPVNPAKDIGSGGAAGNPINGLCRGGVGGGAIYLKVNNTLTLEGRIFANGAVGIQDGADKSGGGGSGGSVYINTTDLDGAFAEIHADGGAVPTGIHMGGSGGGGRISLNVSGSRASYVGSITSSANAGAGSSDRLGDAGTIGGLSW
ncbi:Calx-beta domain-containing protein [Bdellovibrio svalbardensis]|uniref:Calx-beta domain-containing protein n=1 Tax=Bdellovibrio svalbardensis TaxID=2972972 RepID=A0ABT6DF12_9BACT|nr:Calx-beta domain-containing protein [Bdellovibrio svalbardensis]MDG0815429.1 hypothetical protein [Bdellovibrio svalbardensis]